MVEKPKQLFLMDSLGASLTGLLQFIIIRQLSAYVGMPKVALNSLFFIAIGFCIYSAVCFLFLRERWKIFIRLIGVANLLYCALTMALLIRHYSLLTTIGITYFLIEIAIVCGISCVELSVAKQIKEI